MIVIQKRSISKLDNPNLKYNLLPPFKTIWKGDRVFWSSDKDLKNWLRFEHGIGDYQIRSCWGGNKGLKVWKIVVESRQPQTYP